MSDVKTPTPFVPEVKFTKNGYEIRTQILQMASEHLHQEFSYKWMGWEATVKRDNSQVITTVGMPEYPGIEQVLATAETLYNFVQSGAPKAKKDK